MLARSVEELVDIQHTSLSHACGVLRARSLLCELIIIFPQAVDIPKVLNELLETTAQDLPVKVVVVCRNGLRADVLQTNAMWYMTVRIFLKTHLLANTS